MRRLRVARLMRVAGLQCPAPQTQPPDRNALDTRWCGDIADIPTEEGWLYLPPSSPATASSVGTPPTTSAADSASAHSRPPAASGGPATR